MMTTTNFKVALALAACTLSTHAAAGSVTTGEFTLDFDEASLLNLPAQVENVNWFDSAESATLTPQEMRETPPSETVPDRFTFQVFGASIPAPPMGLQERAPQVSTFEYEGDPETGTGMIGLAGFHVISTIAGGMSMGDYGLSYDASRIGNAANSSGWFITNYHAFPLVSFDLTNVELTIIDEANFSLTGDVAIASDLALMLSTEEGTDVGDFSFTTVGENDAHVDGTIANYSMTTEILSLPVVMSNNMNYSASFHFMVLEDGRSALELKNIAPSNVSAASHAMFNMNTGVMSIPEIVILNAGELSGEQVSATMTLEPGHFPSRFILTSVENISE